MSAIIQYFEHSLALPFFGLEWKLIFSSHVATAEFCKFAQHIGYSTLTASSFSVWNSSARVLSPPLAFFIVLLSKAHLTSYSRMSSSKWLTTPSRLSRSLRPFLFSSSVYSCHPFLIFSASVRFLLFLSFIMSEEISSLSHSIVFLYFFALVIEESLLLSPCYSLELYIQFGIFFSFFFSYL